VSDVPPSQIHAWWADHHVADESWLRIVDSDEYERWEAYRRQIDRDRFIVGVTMARALFARALGVPPADVRLDRRCPRCGRPHGKVRLAGTAHIEISVSHSGTWVVLAACHTYPIGVDVEVINPSIDHLSIGGCVLSVREQARLAATPPAERANTLARYWARKEAVVKATGDGLGAGLANLEVSHAPDPAQVLAWRTNPHLVDQLHLRDLSADDQHCASVAIIGPRPLPVVTHDASELLDLVSLQT